MEPENAVSLIAYCRENDRVCPQPHLWNDLYNLLLQKQGETVKRKLLAPLILGAWHFTSNLEKMVRLSEHIHWANEHEKLPLISSFIRHLSEAEWHHLND